MFEFLDLCYLRLRPRPETPCGDTKTGASRLAPAPGGSKPAREATCSNSARRMEPIFASEAGSIMNWWRQWICCIWISPATCARQLSGGGSSPLPVRRGGKEQQVAFEPAGYETRCQQVIVPCDLVHPPDVLFLKDGQRIPVTPQEFHDGRDIQRLIAWIAAEVLYQARQDFCMDGNSSSSRWKSGYASRSASNATSAPCLWSWHATACAIRPPSDHPNMW